MKKQRQSVSIQAMIRYAQYVEKKLRQARKTVFLGTLAEDDVVFWKERKMRYQGYLSEYYKEMAKQNPETRVLK